MPLPFYPVDPESNRKHYFDAEPTVDSDRGEVELILPDLMASFVTDAGVFARSAVDAGSKLLLLDGPAPNPNDTVVADLGAGYGPIAITLAKRNPGAEVWAIEVNSRARQLCTENAQRAGLDNVRVVDPTEVPDDLSFDRLWSNPPIRIGKPALHQLLTTWLGRLKPSGSAHLVVQKHLGSDSLQRWLSANGWPTTRRSSRGGYRLLDVDPASAQPDTKSVE